LGVKRTSSRSSLRFVELGILKVLRFYWFSISSVQCTDKDDVAGRQGRGRLPSERQEDESTPNIDPDFLSVCG